MGDDLLVVSSNFDQRYYAGRLHAFELGPIVARLPAVDEPVLFDEVLGTPSSTVRIDQFANEIVYVPNVGGQDRLLVPTRGRNRLSMIDYRAPGQPSLSCGPAPEEPTRFDCRGRYTDTGSQDPFSAAVLDSDYGPLAFVAHLRSVRDEDEIYRQAVTLVDLEGLATWEEPAEVPEFDNEARPIEPFVFRDFGGVTGVTFVPPGRLGVPEDSLTRIGTLVAVERSITPTLTLRGFTVRGVPPFVLTPTVAVSLEETHVLSLSGETTAIGSRGLVYDAARERVYVSLRFQENGDSFNAAIATVDVSGDTFRILNIEEAGEELGRPVLHQVPNGPRLLYVPDIRQNTIWIFDVSTDAVLPRGPIIGLGERDFDGIVEQVPLLDSPAGMTFYDAGDRQLAFVSNFANSTIAVIDVSDPNPLRHRVVARFGRNIDAEGEQEGP